MPVTGTLIPAPHWYPAYLPLFYRQSDGAIKLLPDGGIKGYTENDVLDCLLYLQTWCGYNRADFQNAVAVSWYKTDNQDGAKLRVENHFKGQVQGDYGWSSPNSRASDGALYAKLQARYIVNEAATMPWLTDMQGKGGGIDLMSIPMASDIELPRPGSYPKYLPSLFRSANNTPYGRPAGFLDTKPKILNNKSSGYTQYTLTAADVANVMVYAQPTIYAGPTPYPMNWYINDNVNGAIAMRFKITIAVASGFTNAQAQTWGIAGDMMKAPVLDANPYASGFTEALQGIISFAVSYFTGKIPGGNKLVAAAYSAGNITGGQFITGSDVPPAGPFSAAVFAAAKTFEKQAENAVKSNYVVLGILAIAGVWWAHNEKVI